MNSLPRELIDAILEQCVSLGSRNDVLQLRLVCRAFNNHLKPFVCQTVALEFSRLSKSSGRRRPDPDALQTIGKHCKAMYVDLMVLRDEMEVQFLSTIFEAVPSMKSFTDTLQRKYCMSDTSFNEDDYRNALSDILFNCDHVERLSVSLPFQLVGQRTSAATMILAHTFSAFAERIETQEEPTKLRTLVVENLSDQTMYKLWNNPVDVRNIMRVMQHVYNLVLTLRRYESMDLFFVQLYNSALWEMISVTTALQTLCLVGGEDGRPPRGLKQTRSWLMSADEWRAKSMTLPAGMSLAVNNLTCLELKRMDVDHDTMRNMCWQFSPALEELYLNEVYLKVEQGLQVNQDTKKILWIGVPNRRPIEGEDFWVAMEIREACPNMRICRASFLGYDHLIRDDIYLHPDIDATQYVSPDFDFADPCGLGRSLAQRFVEVVMGYEQPEEAPTFITTPTPTETDEEGSVNNVEVRGGPITYMSREPREGEDPAALQRLDYLKPRPARFSVTDYDVNAYQTAVRNPAGKWQKSIDGWFPNHNSGTFNELHYIAETACRGMNEIQRQRTATHGSNGNRTVAIRDGTEEEGDEGPQNGELGVVINDDDVDDDETVQPGSLAGGLLNLDFMLGDQG